MIKRISIIITLILLAAAAAGVVSVWAKTRNRPVQDELLAQFPPQASGALPDLPNGLDDRADVSALKDASSAADDPRFAQKSSIMLKVPFVAQAPSGQWSDPRFQDGCEEASSIIAMAWARGKPLAAGDMEQEVTAITAYEQEKWGSHHDTSAQDTAERIIKGYFGYGKVQVERGIDSSDILEQLASGRLVIVPVNGQKLKNPHYTGAGPQRHMLVVIGYDAEKDEFVTNDPGTRHGAGYRYPASLLASALRDYPTGEKVPMQDEQTALIAVELEI